MTGAYIRVQRDGRWDKVEIDQLTDAELAEMAASKPNDGWMWAIFLAKWIRDNVGEEPPVQRDELPSRM
jgi:hypothetical protein